MVRTTRPAVHSSIIAITLALLALGAGPDTASAATVWTDAPNYLLRDTPYITAAGFQFGEVVQLQVLHTDGTPNTGAGHAPFFVTDGGVGDLDGQVNGSIQTTWGTMIPQDDSAGSAFAVTVVGQTSGVMAQAAFTVSNFFRSTLDTIVPSPGGNPSGSDCVTKLQSDQDGNPLFGFLTFIPTGILTFSQITVLNAVFSFPVGHYGGGSPRFEIPVDTDGDGMANGSVFAYIGTPPNFTDPGHMAFISTGNFILDLTTTHWDLTQFGGPFYGTYPQALALLGAFRVLDVELVVDGGFTGDQVALVDSFTVNDKTYLTWCIADLAVAKTDHTGTVLVGTSVTYDITVTNNGPSPVTSLRLQDLIPPQFNPATVVFSPASGSYNAGTGEWTGLNLAMGDSVVMQLTGFVPAATPAGTLTNTVHVDLPPDMRDSVPGNNTATDIDTLLVPTPTATSTPTSTPTVTPTGPGKPGDICADSVQCNGDLFCTDRVCCNTPCDGPLEQCNLPGEAGTCASIAAGAPALTPQGLLAAAAVLAAIAGIALRRRRRG